MNKQGVGDLCQPQEPGVAMRRLHGQPAVCVCKRGPFCLEDKNASGQDPELQWPHYIPLHCYCFPCIFGCVCLILFGYK